MLMLLIIAPQNHYLNKVNGVAFLLIVIMSQAKFLFVRIHALVISNIQKKDS